MTPLEFPYGAAPSPGEQKPILPGIDWVQMPLPFALNHVNCWLFEGESSTGILDTGFATRETRGLWQQVLNDRWPDDVLVTHFHPDHIGLAGWFAERGAVMHGHPTEVAIARALYQLTAAEFGANYAAWYQRHGVPEKAVAAVASVGNHYAPGVVPIPEHWQSVVAGDRVQLGDHTFDVLEGRGHAPCMLMLHDADAELLIGADQLLPKISPNISLMPPASDNQVGYDENPLASYLASLDQLTELPDSTLVLPSHGDPFRGMHQRISTLRAHHEERLDRLREACRTPISAHALFPRLFNRELDQHQLSFALGETLAHLVYLEQLGEVAAVTENEAVRFVVT